MKRNLCRRFQVLATHASEPLSNKLKIVISGNGFADRGMSSGYTSLRSSPKNGACHPSENMNEDHANLAKTFARMAGQRSRLVLLELIALSSLLGLLACNSTRTPNSVNFTNAINQYLAKHGQACTTIGRQFPIDIPGSAPQSQYGFGPQLTALQQASLVSETDTTAVVPGMLDALRGSASPRPVRRYQLTAEGQKYFQQVPGTFGQTGGFCYGQKTVDSLLKWGDPVAIYGDSRTEVTYTYKMVNLAAWATQPEIQRAFPDIGAMVNGASKTNQMIGLQLTNNGWEVSGH
jgi:hypothetical protein